MRDCFGNNVAEDVPEIVIIIGFFIGYVNVTVFFIFIIIFVRLYGYM